MPRQHYLQDSNIERLQHLYGGAAPPPQREPIKTVTWLQDNGATLEEVAVEIGVTHERGRYLEKSALTKFRKWADRHGYRQEDLLRN